MLHTENVHHLFASKLVNLFHFVHNWPASNHFPSMCNMSHLSEQFSSCFTWQSVLRDLVLGINDHQDEHYQSRAQGYYLTSVRNGHFAKHYRYVGLQREHLVLLHSLEWYMFQPFDVKFDSEQIVSHFHRCDSNHYPSSLSARLCSPSYWLLFTCQIA